MTDIQVLKKFAAEVIDLANNAKIMAKCAADASIMHKEAKANEAKPLDQEKLNKAASAVATLYGDRASVSADMLKNVWSSNHNMMVDSILKLASDRISDKAAKEPNMVVVKKANVGAAPKTPRGMSHRDSFDEIFGIVRK